MATRSIFLPGKSHGQGSLAGRGVHEVAKRVGHDIATKQQIHYKQNLIEVGGGGYQGCLHPFLQPHACPWLGTRGLERWLGCYLDLGVRGWENT